ncbi:MAG: radical SAM protein [Gimesia sp.]|jgi:wyosine [tRNA(Phe)-imidazoG37] synthetase (radical SAM superfamily)|uniref:Radical SAM protein n=1 Tax=Gimesia maris TaxID=122 RepID=A0A3D3RAH9_9PLAN|nr:radical SAM protein [Gimesia sp.]HCO25845.1 radical SAM protein [Gimesia maris]|tara:strand:+ start:66203 stop:67072 length:870 start_codon:yes stop_codon:yes gene_type:complete
MSSPLPLHSQHQRTYHDNKFVYPVLSRRSKGISIGINLNPDKICNFDCIYCQVDRREESETRFVGTEQLMQELDHMLKFVLSGEIYQDPKFSEVPAELRRLNDIAFSGDGEPTTYRNFDQIVKQVAALKRKHSASDVKMVLISNASMFHRASTQAALAIFDENQGEIWAKLDAGTEDYFKTIDRTKIRFSQVLDNLHLAAEQRPIVIQSLFMLVNQQPPSNEEIDAYCSRLNDIVQAGGQIKLVQVYTIARRTAEEYVASLSTTQVDEIAHKVAEQTKLPVEVYYGNAD